MIVGSSLFSQTKMIAYKSHSGSANNMERSIEMDLFNMPNSNLGAAPERFVFNAQLDSLIFLDDTSTVMVTSNYCFNTRIRNDKALWRAGRDTVKHHEVFRTNLSEDSIRKIIKSRYHFVNDPNQIVFVNHPTSLEDEVQQEEEPEEEGEEEKKPKKKKKKRKKKNSGKSSKKKAKKRTIRNLWKKPGCSTFLLGICFIAVIVSFKRSR